MLARRDFCPEVTKLGIFNEYETLDAVIARANQWVRENDLRVLNIETLLLKRGSNEVSISGYAPTTLHQVIRVWYEVEEPPIVEPVG